MNRLNQAFRQFAQHERLILPGHRIFTDEMLHRWLHSSELGSWKQDLNAARVAVCLQNNEDLALALLALDGAVASIILLPPDLQSDDLKTLVCNSAPTHWLANGNQPAPAGLLSLALPPPPKDKLLVGADRPTATVSVDTEWILATSGTTKTPKLVVHTLETLAKSVKRDAGKGRNLRWGLLYDLNRFAGIQVFLQAVLGDSLLAMPPQGIPLAETLGYLAAHGCNALSATPTMWRRILMLPEGNDLRLLQITLGGEIADGPVLHALSNAHPHARIVHIYASTEAGVGFAVADGQEGFPRSYLDHGVPGADLRIDESGILLIRPAVSGQRYLAEPEKLSDHEGFVRTGDRVRVEGERVYFMGRDSGAINVGGNKVQPEEVERVLLEHPAVAIASVIPKRSGIMGSLIEAHLVLRNGDHDPAAMPAQVRAWCSNRLERHKVPAIIRIVDRIETGATGKIDRKAH